MCQASGSTDRNAGPFPTMAQPTNRGFQPIRPRHYVSMNQSYLDFKAPSSMRATSSGSSLSASSVDKVSESEGCMQNAGKSKTKMSLSLSGGLALTN